MFFRIIRKILQRHFKEHLLIPLIVGLAIEFGAEFLERKYHGVFTYIRPVAPLLGVMGAYLVIMYFIFKRETEVGFKRIRSITLVEALKGAKGYFAVGAIDLKEWFEPSPQVYLASIMKRKLEYKDFAYDRVLLFSKGGFKDAFIPYLSDYYARALVNIHVDHGIRLAFLKPNELDSIIAELKLDKGKAVGYYPSWLRETFLKFTPSIWKGLWNRRLALGEVIYPNGESKVLRFSKHGGFVDVDEATPEARAAYDELLKLIKERIYHGSDIEPNHDFIREVVG